LLNKLNFYGIPVSAVNGFRAYRKDGKTKVEKSSNAA
jgi:hypothetical protein